MRGVEQIPWIYDAIMRVAETIGLRRWRIWLTKGAGGRVLDFGCGTGRNLPLYRPDTFVVGIDPSRAPLMEARRRRPGVALVRARGEALPFREGAFDVVVSGLAFCSVDDVPGALSEVRRVLRAGGTLRMLEHVRSTRFLYGRWQDFIQPAWTKIAGGCRPNRDTEESVRTAGFTIDSATRRARGTMRRFVAS